MISEHMEIRVDIFPSGDVPTTKEIFEFFEQWGKVSKVAMDTSMVLTIE